MGSVLAFFLYSGTTFACFKQFGNVPDENEVFMHSARISWSSFMQDSIMFVGMESGPFDFFFASFCKFPLLPPLCKGLGRCFPGGHPLGSLMGMFLCVVWLLVRYSYFGIKSIEAFRDVFVLFELDSILYEFIDVVVFFFRFGDGSDGVMGCPDLLRL